MGIRRAAIQTTADRTVSYQSGQSTNGTISSGGGTLVTSIVYTDNNYNTLTANAASTTFGTFRILGTGFTNGANVMLSNTSAGTIANVTTNTSYVSSGEIRANVSVTAGNYTLYIFNPNGTAAIYYSGVLFEPYPQWTTTSYNSLSVVNVQLLTSSTAVEQPITYALVSGTLPTGTSLSANGLISGTATGITGTGQTFTFTVSATDIYNETTQSSITLTISLADIYFDYTTLLLNGETNTGTNYIADASTNNFALTVNGAATPNRFSPLWGNGYYGNYFSTTSTYLSAGTSAQFSFGTSNFTVEGWLYNTGTTAPSGVIVGATSYGVGTNFLIYLNGSTNALTYYGPTGVSVATSAIATNTWYHFALVRNGTTVTIYINGVSSASVTDGNSIPSTFSLTIGNASNNNSNDQYIGYLSNIRIVNGTALYTSNFTPSTTPLTAIANTALLTCQSANFVDNSTNAFTLTPNGTVKVVPNQPFGALPSGVQNYGSSLFDGSTGYLSVPNNSAFYFGTGDFTIEWWWYLNSAFSATNGPGIGQKLTDPTGGWVIYRNASVNTNLLSIRLAGQSGAGNADYVCTAAPIQNVWEHWAVVRSGTTLTWYKNGVASGVTTSVSTNITDTSTTAPMYVGFAQTWSYYIQNSYISNLRVLKGTAIYTANFTPPTTPLTAITNTALLTLQNKQGYNNNVLYDDSVNNFPITRTGTPTQGTFTPFSQTGWSNYWPGSGSLTTAMTSTLAPGTNAFTIECWVYNIAWNSSNPIIQCRLYNNGTSGSWSLYITSGTLYFDQVVVSGTIIQTNNVVPLNAWTHLAVTRDSSNVWRLFVNGVSSGTTTPTNNINLNYTGANMYIGCSNDATGASMNGYISNLRFVNGNALYTSNFTPPTVPLTAIANTVLLTCQSNRYLDNSTNAYAITPNSGTTIQVLPFSPFAPGVSYSSANNGGSMYFNGSTDYLSSPGSTAFTFGTGDYTVEYWVYFLNVPSSGYSAICGSSTTPNGFGFGIAATKLYMTTSATGYSSTNNTILPNQWYHVAWVRRSGATNAYLNGTLDYSPTSGGVNVTETGFFIGAAGSSGYYSNAYISNLRVVKGTAVYTSNFTPSTAPPTPTANTTLLLLGTNTGVQDATGKNDIITVGSAKTQANTVKYGTGAMQFSSTNYLTLLATPLVSAFGSGSFTVEAWIYPTQSGTFTLASSNYNYSSGTGNWSFYFSPGSASLLYFNTTSVNHASSTTTTISLNTWTHIAYSRNGSTAYFFVNGTQVGTTVSDTTNYPSGGLLYIGQQNDGTGSATGYIDDLRITKGIARYTANFTPPAFPDLTL